MVNGRFHLLVAIGSFVGAGKLTILSMFDNFTHLKRFTGSSVTFHNLGRIAASEAINLGEVGRLRGRSVLLLRLHAAFMLAAWIGAASIGILLARYFKQTWVGSQLCGKDQWFAVCRCRRSMETIC